MTATQRKRRPLLERKYTPLRLSIDALKLMDLLSRKRGISRTSVIEWALRDMAEKHGVQQA